MYWRRPQVLWLCFICAPSLFSFSPATTSLTPHQQSFQLDCTYVKRNSSTEFCSGCVSISCLVLLSFICFWHLSVQPEISHTPSFALGPKISVQRIHDSSFLICTFASSVNKHLLCRRCLRKKTCNTAVFCNFSVHEAFQELLIGEEIQCASQQDETSAKTLQQILFPVLED